MSASSLPSEIWSSILDFATYTPKSLEPDIYTLDDWSHDSAGYRQVAALEKSLDTKRATISVCRQWKTLATPFLYECLMLRDVADISSLLDTLSAHLRSSCDSLPLGSYAKRLDVAFFDDTRDRYTAEGNSVLGMLPQLLHLLPNLTVLHTWTIYPFHWPPSAFDAFIDTCGQSLKVLKWSRCPHISLDSEGLVRLLASTPNLRVLAMGPLLADMPPLSLTNANLEKLVTLEITYSYHGPDPARFINFTHISLPSLRELHIGQHPSGHQELRQFLTAHGGQLCKITLDVTRRLQQRVIDLLVELCPRLLVAEFRFHRWQAPNASVLRSLVFLPVTELRLQCRDLRQTPAMVSYFIEHLASLTQPSPLSAVRLSDSDNVKLLRVSQTHGHLVADWRARVSIPLLDHEGLSF